MISKWKESFEYIPKKILDKLPKKDRYDLYKFRRVRKKIFEWENDVEELNNEIKKKKKRIKEYKKIVTHLYEKINVLRSDFVPIVNVVSYSKSGFLYWNLNVKMKKQIRSIYLGSDKKLREIFKSKIGMRKNINKDKLKEIIEYEIVDEVVDMVIENKNKFSEWNIDKEKLWKIIG